MARQYYGYNPVNQNNQNTNSGDTQQNQSSFQDPPPKYRGYNPVGQNQNNLNNINQNYNQQNTNFVQPQVNTSQQNNQLNYASNSQIPIYLGPFPHKVRKSDLDHRIRLELYHGTKEYAQDKGTTTLKFLGIATLIVGALLLIPIPGVELDILQKGMLTLSALILIVSTIIGIIRHNTAGRNAKVGNYSLYEDRLSKVSESMSVDMKNKTTNPYYILYLEGLGMSYKTVSPAFSDGDLVIVQTVNVHGKKEILQVIRK